MNYTFGEVLQAFGTYIAENPNIDICKTKYGYAVLHYNPATKNFMYVPDILATPEDMLQCLREEIVLDVMEPTGHDLEEATKEELKEIENRTNRYMRPLPCA